MKYTAYFDLENSIRALRSRLIKNIAFSIIISIMLIVKLFLMPGATVFSYVLTLFLFFGILLSLQRSVIMPKVRFINQTASSLEFNEQGISVVTLPIKLPLWANKNSMEVHFSLAEMKIRKLAYPLNPFIDRSSKAFEITDTENKAYVVLDCFDDELEIRINELINRSIN